MKLLEDIDDHQIIVQGTRFRHYAIGLNVADPKDDYYEYMLVNNPSDTEYLLLVCVVGYKSGHSLTLVEANNSHSVTGRQLKLSMGVENTFILID